MSKRSLLLLLCVCLAVLGGCSRGPVSTWNFLVYLDGDNNLEYYALRDFYEMSEAGPSDQVRILVLFDRGGGVSADGGWADTRLFEIKQGMTPADAPLPYLAPGTELDMANPNTLRDFIVYCQNNYPADHTLLTLWDHGGGVWPKTPAAQRSICEDDTTGSNVYMGTAQVAQALTEAESATGKRVELIDMDACLMQMLEVAYEWRQCADYLVGSEEIVPGWGSNYLLTLTILKSYPWLTVPQYAIRLVDAYRQAYAQYGEPLNYSALSLGTELDGAAAAFADLAAALQQTANLAGVRDAAAKTTSFYWPEYKDLWDFAGELQHTAVPTAVKTAAARLQTALDRAILHYHGTGAYASIAHGVSILLPNSSQWSYYSGADQYQTLALPSGTDWYAFVLRYAASSP